MTIVNKREILFWFEFLLFPLLKFFQEENELLRSTGISHHKKLCIQLKRAERNLLQNALKYAAVSRSKVSASRLETDQNSELKTEKNTSNGDGTTPTNASTSDGMDEATAALNQLGVQAE